MTSPVAEPDTVEPTVRERLIAAAGAVIDDVGEEHLTLAQVVRRAGLSTGAVYSNFENREELVLWVYLERHAARLRETLAGLDRLFATARDATELAEAAEHLIIRPDDEVAKVGRWLRVRVIAGTQRYPRIRMTAMELQRQASAHLVQLIETAQARGDIDRSHDARSLALILQQFAFTLVLADLSGDLAPDPEHWVTLIQALVRRVLVTQPAG